jgi:hypothetical protein
MIMVVIMSRFTTTDQREDQTKNKKGRRDPVHLILRHLSAKGNRLSNADQACEAPQLLIQGCSMGSQFGKSHLTSISFKNILMKPLNGAWKRE